MKPFLLHNARPRLSAKLSTLVVIFGLVLAGCSSTNRLGEYQFQGNSVAVQAPFAPPPIIATDILAEAAIGEHDAGEVGLLFRTVTGLVKEVEASKAQRRLDSAAVDLDVSMIIAQEVLHGASQTLDAIPSDDPHAADFMIRVFVEEHGFYAGPAFGSYIEHFLEAKIVMTNNQTGRKIWQRKINLREPISQDRWALLGNLKTAKELRNLSEEELGDALEQMSFYTADVIRETLRHDLARAYR